MVEPFGMGGGGAGINGFSDAYNTITCFGALNKLGAQTGVPLEKTSHAVHQRIKY